MSPDPRPQYPGPGPAAAALHAGERVLDRLRADAARRLAAR